MNKVLRPEELLAAEPVGAMERVWARGVEALALLRAIELGELLSETPASSTGRTHHQIGVSLLNILERELLALIEEARPAEG